MGYGYSDKRIVTIQGQDADGVTRSGRVDSTGQVYTRAQLTDGTDALTVDAVTRAITEINYEHHEIHSGRHYFLDRYILNLAVNNVFDLQIDVPDVDRRLHVTFKINPESETIFQFYEGVTIVTTGTEVEPVNNDRESLNTSVATFYEITNGSIADANADTATAGATLLSSGIIGSGKDAGNADRTAEVILARNTHYSMRFIADTAGYIDYTFRWYEHVSRG